MVKFRVSKQGMKRGYWKIVDSKGSTINSGISSKKGALAIAKKMNR